MEYAVAAWLILGGILLVLLYALRHRPAAAKIIRGLKWLIPSFDPRIMLLSASLGTGMGLVLLAQLALRSDDVVIFLVTSLAVSIVLFVFLVRSFGIVFSINIDQKQRIGFKIFLVVFAVWIVVAMVWAFLGV